MKKSDPKYVDMQRVDPPVPGQEFVVMSFVAPETNIKDKQLYFFEKFARQWEYTHSVQKFIQFLEFVSYKYNVPFEEMTTDLTEFAKDEKEKLIDHSFEDDFKTFMDTNKESLQKQYDQDNKFQTNVRGLKVRGSYATVEEAKARSIKLRDDDPDHNVFVGCVGRWMPFDPDAYETGETEFMEEELNALMHQKTANEEVAKRAFDQRLLETKRQAIANNIEIAEKTGNKLTQTILPDGTLVGINHTNTHADFLTGDAEDGEESVSIEQVCDALFSGDGTHR